MWVEVNKSEITKKKLKIISIFQQHFQLNNILYSLESSFLFFSL
jgi:hypothetical protein